MTNSIFTQTAQRPTSGMPAYGPSFGARVAVPATISASVSTCARSRHMGDMGLATTKGVFPGIPAWRPPTC